MKTKKRRQNTNFKVAFSATSAGILHVREFDLHIRILCIQIHLKLFLWINPSNLRHYYFLHRKNNKKCTHNTIHANNISNCNNFSFFKWLLVSISSLATIFDLSHTVSRTVATEH